MGGEGPEGGPLEEKQQKIHVSIESIPTKGVIVGTHKYTHNFCIK